MELVTRSELARRAEVSRAAVTRGCSRRLKNAVHGDFVDVDNPRVMLFIKHGRHRAEVKRKKEAFSLKLQEAVKANRIKADQ